jgi:hypothetical protein
MSMNVLNIGAGYVPIQAKELLIKKIVNYDPGIRQETLQELRGVPDFHYCGQRTEVDALFSAASVDCILGVSPYNFQLIDDWADKKLKPGGYVVVAANEKNNYAKPDGLFATPNLRSKYAVTPQAPDWIFKILKRILRDYPSHVSSGSHGTTLNAGTFYWKTDRG